MELDSNITKSIQTYYIKPYPNENLEYQNKINKGNVLLVNPFSDPFVVGYKKLKNISVAEIIQDINMVTPNGQNYVVSNKWQYRSIGIIKISKLIKTIENFQDQVVRQSLLTNNRNINLFELSYENKKAIVNELYKEIVEYFSSSQESSYIWGTLTDSQKKQSLLQLQEECHNWLNAEHRKNNIVTYFASYTTLPELEELKDKRNFKVLERFISK